MLTIVDSHHKVLLAWAKFRSSLSTAPRLITLDHHTDTSPAFRHFIKKAQSLKPKDEGFNTIQSKLLSELNFKNEQSVKDSIEKLNNDEHIVAAIKTDIIAGAFVIAHNAADTNLEIYKEHKIACRTITDHNTVLESLILDKALNSFDEDLENLNENRLFESPYILDIDLDYFNTFESVKPSHPETFKKLISNAGIITIATEPEYVESCALDKGLTSAFLLKSLKEQFL